ncbi:MAG: metal ABC transporter permease [Atopococcus tabaci]|uniref:Metal ABC transporter permease n=1 Tax=Atopococcus tabaci TaxID=269774 RepID=A0AA43UCR5_9LACT|nr:metal ABC transporter permease [Atopococcus tabaci]
MSLVLEIILVAIAVSLSCSVLGVFLVLRGSTMVSDAITHTVLLGIVVSFFIVQDLRSPWLIIGASLVGVFTVWAIEALKNTGLVDQDASIGIVFPLLFSIAIILLTRYAGDVHLDIDAVFMGQLGFTIFDRVIIGGVDIGPGAFWSALIIFLLNSGFIAYFYKELKVSTFDPNYARSIGISTTFIYYALMTLVSITSVGAFEAVGSILVVGFMVGPALTAYLLTDRLIHMIGVTLLVSVFNAAAGVSLAYSLNLSYAGVIAFFTGIVAVTAFIFSPKKGALRGWVNRRRQKN